MLYHAVTSILSHQLTQFIYCCMPGKVNNIKVSSGSCACSYKIIMSLVPTFKKKNTALYPKLGNNLSSSHSECSFHSRSSQSLKMPSPSPCHLESSSTWRRSSRSMNSKAWKSTSSTKWSTKRSRSAPDLLSPLSRSETGKAKSWRNKHTHTCTLTQREIHCCQC